MDLSDTGRAVSTATEAHQDDELGRVMATIVRLRELRDQGFDHEEIARRITVDHPQTPGGGTWSATTVDQVLRVAETSELEHRRALGADRFRPSTSWRRFGVAVGLLPLLVAAGIVFYFVSGSSGRTATELVGSDQSISDQARTTASQTLLSEVANEAASSNGIEMIGGLRPVPDEEAEHPTLAGEGSVDGGTGPEDQPPLVVDIDDLPQGDPADMLSIRVEDDDDSGNGSGPSPPFPSSLSTATIRSDGKLHIEGAFPSQAAADAFIARATRIFGPEALIESYTVDPAAPRPEVSSVALDKPVLFQSGSTEIHPDYIPFLEACAGVLGANSHIVMSVAAYTDSAGDEQLNLELSQQRAQAVIDFYRALDIDDAQLLAAGFGEENPVADNSSVQGRAQNRRAMLRLLNIMDEG